MSFTAYLRHWSWHNQKRIKPNRTNVFLTDKPFAQLQSPNHRFEIAQHNTYMDQTAHTADSCPCSSWPSCSCRPRSPSPASPRLRWRRHRRTLWPLFLPPWCPWLGDACTSLDACVGATGPARASAIDRGRRMGTPTERGAKAGAGTLLLEMAYELISMFDLILVTTTRYRL